MYRLDPALSAALTAGHTLIVPNRQRAAAVRVAYAWQQRSAGRRVWSTPDAIAWEAWLAREFTRARQQRGEGPVLLNVSQQQVLWQQVLAGLANDPEEAQLYQRHAGAIAEAAAVAREWGLHWSAAGAHEEAALLQRALQRMQQACAERGVAAVALLDDAQLALLQPSPVTFAGFAALTPRQRNVAARFAAAGQDVELQQPATAPVAAVARSYGSPDGEHAAIGAWCHERLAADAGQRLLVICAGSREQGRAVRDAIAARSGDVVALEGGEPLAAQPLIATGLALLRLGAAELDFALLSRVLLAPFHGLGAHGACVRLELWLRDRLPQRAGRAAALGELAAAPAELAAPAARVADHMRAMATLDDAAPLSALAWVRVLTERLLQSGYPGRRKASSGETQAWQRWEAALEELASLQAYLGTQTWSAALQRLESLLERAQHQAATGDSPVTVSAWREDPVVDYDAVWACGLTEAQWPQAPRPEPFLPLALQRTAGLPAASAHASLAAARSQLGAWRSRAQDELVLSWPRTDGDVDQEPGVLLHGLAAEPCDTRRRSRVAPGQAREGGVEESLPPVALRGTRLRAGARLPELQRECPFRAQAELRFGARGLATPRVGIDPRLRGLYLHRALERLWLRIGSGTALRSRPIDAWQDAIDAATAAAFATPEPGFGAPPTARQLARERDRCRELLREALLLEMRRDVEFTVEDSEHTTPWRVAGVELSLRIDRIDRLADGSRVIIDYKTGASSRVELFAAPARPVQLLAYLDALHDESAGDVAALALLKLVPGGTQFRAAEDGRARLPVPRAVPRPDVPWAEQLAAWRADVRGLVASHLAGAAQVAPLPHACDYCPLPALCRIDAAGLRASLDVPADDVDATEREDG